jgi:ATP-binding cassette subfamily B protein
MYLRNFSHPIANLASVANTIQSAVAAAERIFELLDEKEQSPEPALPVGLESTRGEVDFSHVRFAYQPDVELIRDLSAHIRSGDSVAIVGPTGAGKTTLVNLLLRFYDIQGGAILIDGVDIAAWSATAALPLR